MDDMATQATAHPVAFFTGVVMGGLIVGLVLGLLPLAVGALTAQRKLGATGFLCCLGGGLVGGVVVALPVAIGFSIVAVVRSRKAKAVAPGAVPLRGPDPGAGS